MRGPVLFLSIILFGRLISAADLGFITVSPNGSHFIQGQNTRFVPWGFNYDRDSDMRLLEDYWITEWSKVERDFREMKKLGANVVRIHPQLGRFMISPEEPNAASLHQLGLLVALAEKLGLYLDITGLGCYHKSDLPPWYDPLAEADRWHTQARFWQAIAKVCARSPAIFCYDLMNEPVLPGPLHPAPDWLGPPFAGKFYYVQYIARDLAGRTRKEVAHAWVEQLRTAIRSEDKKHLITLGFLPWTASGFVPQELRDQLDFISVHLYPVHDKVKDSMKVLAEFSVKKPLVIEETFPLHCSPPELRDFIWKSKKYATGWIGFYWGKTMEEYRGSTNASDGLIWGWLKTFSEGPPITRPSVTRR